MAAKKRKITAAEQRKERKLRPIRRDESDLKYIKKEKKIVERNIYQNTNWILIERISIIK